MKFAEYTKTSHGEVTIYCVDVYDYFPQNDKITTPVIFHETRKCEQEKDKEKLRVWLLQSYPGILEKNKLEDI